jgi:hypothetical protein
MNLGPNDKDRLLRFGTIGGAVLVVVIYGYIQLRTPDAPPPAAPVVVAVKTPAKKASTTPTTVSTSTGVVTKAALEENSAGKVGTTAAQYDPSLHMEAMLVTEGLVYGGSGRNIFSANSAPIAVKIPQPIAPIRPIGPVVPQYTGPPVPPPPPPIDLKFFGTETKADGSRQAFLLHGDDVFLASTGNIVQRRYKIGVISANSVEVEDMSNNNKQSLPLQKN